MAKESKYGEETKMLSFRIPISLVDEINQTVKLRLLDFEKSRVISGNNIIPIGNNLPVFEEPFKTKNSKEKDIPKWDDKLVRRGPEKKSNPTDIKFEKTTAESYDGKKSDSLLGDELGQFAKPKKVVDMDALRAIANGQGVKSELFSKKKVNIDDEYSFEVVKVIPDINDQIYIDKKQIAFYDKYDIGVFYVKWEGRYLRFEDKKEFDRFCKDNEIK
jgi:hypothetical protein